MSKEKNLINEFNEAVESLGFVRKPRYERFHVQQKLGKFALLDEKTGWVWKNIRRYDSVLAMMNYILENELEFRDEEYRRIRRLDGDAWEREFGQ